MAEITMKNGEVTLADLSEKPALTLTFLRKETVQVQVTDKVAEVDENGAPTGKKKTVARTVEQERFIYRGESTAFWGKGKGTYLRESEDKKFAVLMEYAEPTAADIRARLLAAEKQGLANWAAFIAFTYANGACDFVAKGALGTELRKKAGKVADKAKDKKPVTARDRAAALFKK